MRPTPKPTPAERATSIADKEANKTWEKTHDLDRTEKVWNTIYADALKELYTPKEV